MTSFRAFHYVPRIERRVERFSNLLLSAHFRPRYARHEENGDASTAGAFGLDVKVSDSCPRRQGNSRTRGITSSKYSKSFFTLDLELQMRSVAK